MSRELKPTDFDTRPVYRYSARLGRWVFVCSGRWIGRCPVQLHKLKPTFRAVAEA